MLGAGVCSAGVVAGLEADHGEGRGCDQETDGVVDAVDHGVTG